MSKVVFSLTEAQYAVLVEVHLRERLPRRARVWSTATDLLERKWIDSPPGDYRNFYLTEVGRAIIDLANAIASASASDRLGRGSREPIASAAGGVSDTKSDR